MKFLSILLVLPILTGAITQEPQASLRGRYKIIFEEKFSSQNGTITFDTNGYKRVSVNDKSTLGKIDCQKFRVVLKDDNSVLQMILSKGDIGKDTITFSTIDLSKKVNADILIDEGKLIKLR